MAKKSSIEKNNRRKRMTKNAAPRRAKHPLWPDVLPQGDE